MAGPRVEEVGSQMREPQLWWQQHRMRVPPAAPYQRYTAQHYPWGVAVWEGPTSLMPRLPVQIVDVVLADPDTPLQVASEVATRRMPHQGQAVASTGSLADPATQRKIFAGVMLVGAVVALTSVLDSAWPFFVGLLVGLGAFVESQRRKRHRRGPAAVAAGAAPVRFTGRVVLADAICQRAVTSGAPHAAQVVRTVRVALWECRGDDHRQPARLNRWLADIARGDELAQGVAAAVRAAGSPAPGGAPMGEPSPAARGAAFAPQLVGSLATPDEARRDAVLDQLLALRDAVAAAAAARESLDATVTRASLEPSAVAPVVSRAVVGEAEQDARHDRVAGVLDELRAEARILREVDAELRQRDGRG